MLKLNALPSAQGCRPLIIQQGNIYCLQNIVKKSNSPGPGYIKILKTQIFI
jgi:hypothetical protein